MSNHNSLEALKQQLQEKAKDYYRNGKPDLGDKVWKDIDTLEEWERRGFTGDTPVDLAQYGLELAVADGPDAPEAPKEAEAALPVDAPGPDASTVVDEVVRREQLRREAQAAKARGNSVTAADKWRELLAIDPMTPKRKGSQQYAAAAADQSQRKMLNDLRRKASRRSPIWMKRCVWRAICSLRRCWTTSRSERSRNWRVKPDTNVLS
ncbi:MAG: hypothetical protein HZY76_22845 [Anaerolineae bacterium]|nr:MAG: hypothetical protein HZY76_22845 [Anaerolineae bacterium]